MSDRTNAQAEQPLVQHLIELRNRLLRVVLCVVLLFLGLFYFANDIYTFVAEPIQSILPEHSTMIATEVASPFLTPFKLTFYTALYLSMPYLLYHIWSFIAPGLYDNEKRIALPILVSSVLLFYAGMAFAYFVVFPLIFGFFAGISPEGVVVMPDIKSYLDIVLKLFFAFGFAFEIPIATILLIWSGTVTPSGLASKRPYVIVVCFIIGMLLTPPDIISQLLLAIPMWLLFECGIFFGRILYRQTSDDSEDAHDH